jgi:hypothetical protein
MLIFPDNPPNGTVNRFYVWRLNNKVSSNVCAECAYRVIIFSMGCYETLEKVKSQGKVSSEGEIPLSISGFS